MVRQHTLLSVVWMLLSLTVGIQTVSAQKTHRNVMADIALECLVTAMPTPSRIQLTGTGRAVVIEPAVQEGLLSRGFELAEEGGYARLAYNVEYAGVDLSRKGRKQVTRVVSLSLSYTLSDASGTSITNSGTCNDQRTDVVQRSQLGDLGNPGFPETNPAIPPKGGWRRVVEPVVLIAATAVGTYLFFNLRSRRADSG